MAQPESVEDVKKLIKEHEIEFIFASFTEVQGKSSAKLVPASQVDALFSEGVGLPGLQPVTSDKDHKVLMSKSSQTPKRSALCHGKKAWRTSSVM